MNSCRSAHSFFPFFRIAALMLIVMSALSAGAQSSESGASDISLFMGYMLPNQIENVTEIMPVFGGRYALSVANVGAVEIEGLNTHSYGVDFTSFALNLRGEIPLMPGLSGIIYGGPDLHYYIPNGDNVRHTDYGVHFGAGGLMWVSDTLWLRTDLKFLGNPGTQLQLLFGLMFRPPAAN